jgi:hypothetical protein
VKYEITLTTVASVTVTVEAENEDIALNRAHDAAREFSGQYHQGRDWRADLNEEWQLEEPNVREVN